jgi:hypothetical protein
LILKHHRLFLCPGFVNLRAGFAELAVDGMRGSWELENRGTILEIVAPLQKYGTGRMIGIRLSEYTHGPRYKDALDRRRSLSVRDVRFSVNFGPFSIFESKHDESSKCSHESSNGPRELGKFDIRQ